VLVVLVDLLLHFHGLFVERVLEVGDGTLAVLLVEEVFVDSCFVERRALVDQSLLVVGSVREVLLDGIFVVLVVLVFQSLHKVVVVLEVDLGLADVDDVLGGLVVGTLLVCQSFLQVLGLAKVLRDGKAMVLALLILERLVVEVDIFEFLGSQLLQAVHRFLVLGQENFFVLCASGLMTVLVGLDVSRVTRQGGLRGLGGLRSLGSLRSPGSGNSGRLRLTSLYVVHLEEFAGSKFVVNITSLDVVLSVTGEGGGKCGSTKEGDSEESDFSRFVLHDVKTRVRIGEGSEVSSSKDRPMNVRE